MKYRNIIDGIFLSRPNRFIAHVEIEGRDEVVHVKNTGRCKELLVPGCRVYLSVSGNPARKTKYDLVAVEKIHLFPHEALCKIQYLHRAASGCYA